ncbi:MBL fold metallo-hydrolase [uncultured Thalassolituus sp.]|uniref:MBL fold metallo-hydrolase n=1 Tax=uncultured Thalassolituus sp. TaxID=285273 RepID=UPI0026064B3E|nr:MBL fold metallo-hydrolase [uncultured Thalassolituus sp.]
MLNKMHLNTLLRPGFFAVLLGLMLTGCSEPAERTAYPLPEQTQDYRWTDIRERASSVLLTVFDTGEVKVPVSGVLDNLETYPGSEDKSRWVKVFAFHFNHPQYGDVLIDTGLDRRFQSGGQGSYRGVLAPFIVEDSRQQRGQNIGAQLKRAGISPNLIFLSHIHGDHTSGLPEMPQGARVIATAGESFHDYPLIMYNDHFDGVVQIEELDMAAGRAMGPFERVVDVFGDQTFFAIATPGHTAGNLSFLINSSEGWVLLTGDASHTRYGFDNNIIPGWAEDRNEAMRSLEALRTFAEKNPQITVIAGHEW